MFLFYWIFSLFGLEFRKNGEGIRNICNQIFCLFGYDEVS